MLSLRTALREDDAVFSFQATFGMPAALPGHVLSPEEAPFQDMVKLLHEGEEIPVRKQPAQEVRTLPPDVPFV